MMTFAQFIEQFFLVVPFLFLLFGSIVISFKKQEREFPVFQIRDESDAFSRIVLVRDHPGN